VVAEFENRFALRFELALYHPDNYDQQTCSHRAGNDRRQKERPLTYHSHPKSGKHETHNKRAENANSDVACHAEASAFCKRADQPTDDPTNYNQDDWKHELFLSFGELILV
jgi:hypothetical protein